MENKREMDDSFYVIRVEERYYNSVNVAKLDPETHNFYDYREYEGIPNCTDYQLGEKVELNGGSIQKTDNSISDEVLAVIYDNENFCNRLKEKYRNIRFGSYNRPPHIRSIISDYVRDRDSNGLPVDLYVVDIIRLLSVAMGLRVRWNNGGSLYHQTSAFKYPEQLYEVVSAMYDILSEKLAANESMTFILYEYGGVGKEFKDFKKELERRTRYSEGRFGSDLEDRIRSEAYHGENWGFSERRRQLSIMKPTMLIAPNQTTYYHDRSNDKAIVESTTPEEAEKNLSLLLRTTEKTIKLDNKKSQK